MLLMGKETHENCSIVGKLQNERKEVNFTLDSFDNPINVHTKMSMIDEKLHTLLTGTGGAFCCLCCFSESACNDKDFITAGFPINRSHEQT